MFEAVLQSPLPGVFKFGFVLGFIVGGIQVVYTRLQTSFHDGQILIRQGHVDHQFGLKAADQRNQCRHVLGVYSGGADVLVTRIAFYIVDNHVALGFGAAGHQDF